MGEPCYNCKCPAYIAKDRITGTTGKCDYSPDCTEFISYEVAMNSFGSSPTQKPNKASNLPCYNDNCYAVSKMKKMSGCVFSDTCPDFMATGFGSAKKKTNFDHIREDFTAEKFAETFGQTGCPGNMDAEDCTFVGNCKDCWLSWLNSEYHN